MSTPMPPTDHQAEYNSSAHSSTADGSQGGQARLAHYNDAPQGERIHAFRDDALGELDAVGVAEAVASKQISAREAVAAAVERARAVDPTLNAVEFWDDVRALDRAGRVDAGLLGNHHERRGAALRGVPSAFKDNVLVGNLPMTQGSAAIPRKAGRRNGKVVQQVMGTGVLPIATTTMPPFGWTATTERPGGNVTRNPWDTNRSSGGSSGGSAALVAAGVIPIAHGNDGGGSIRIPAAACGLVGLKPTRGRLVLGESSARMPVKLVTDSVLTRTVRDTIAFFEDAQRVRPARRLEPIAVSADPSIGRSLEVGVMMDSPFASPTDADTRAAVEITASLLEGLGHSVAPYSPDIPSYFQQDFIDYWGFLAFNTVSSGKSLFHPEFDADKLDPFTVGLAEMGKRRLRHAPKFLTRLQASQVVYRRQLASGPDIVVSPVLGHVSPAIGWLDGDLDFETHLKRLLEYCCFTPLHNATGAPAISLPMGRTASGLPVGVLISGTHGSESLLLKVALQLEQAQPFARIQD